MPERKICLINDSFPPVIDGVANAVTNYAKIIQKDYGKAAVVTPYYPDADDSVFDFPVFRYPSIDFTKMLGYRAGCPLAPETMQKIEDGHFNLLHSHCPVTSTVLARMLRDRLHVPLVFTYHTKFDIDIAHAIRGKALQEAALKLLVENISACDEVWTVSRGAGENLRANGYQGDYIVMPNGVDFSAGRADAAQVEAVCAGLDLPHDVPVYLFVGRMMWYKGLRIILDSMKAMKDAGYDFRMVFVGKGTDGPEIERYSHELGLDDKVIFAAPAYDREVIRAWYCRADLFLFPSTFDTNGLVVREAAACALPSVLIAGSCAAEDVTDGQNGFFIEENAQSMTALLQKLYSKRELLRQVGEHAQKEIYISWETAVKHACARYEIVLDNFRAGKYPAHEAPTDELLRGAAGLMAGINYVRRESQQLRESATENREKLQESYEQSREKMQQALDSLWQRLDRFL